MSVNQAGAVGEKTFLLVCESGKQYLLDPPLSRELRAYAEFLDATIEQVLHSLFIERTLDNAMAIVCQRFSDLSLMKLRAKVGKRAYKVLEVESSAPARKGMVKQKRNDPCPCGSGKKFKQCCLP